jgi:RND family efflux transporter MFP subunit
MVALLGACKDDVEKIKPVYEAVSESIYASGTLKSVNQYEAFATVNGIIENIFVSEGDTVKKGTPILSISNETQRLNRENAGLAAAFSDFAANQGKLNEAKLAVDFARNKMKNDSALYFRQQSLWQQQIGTKTELEQRELNYQNARNSYYAANVRYDDLKRQLKFTSEQANTNLQITTKLAGDYILKSETDGIVYSLGRVKGEPVSMQTPLAVIGDARQFVLEMQVDEYDIFKIKKGLQVLVTMDSYKGEVFEAVVTRVNPLMNERSKTFEVEATFVHQPAQLYPNISFEANIVIRSSPRALLIPRSYLQNDSLVYKTDGTAVKVKTGLKDYKKVEIISGITADDELILPPR